MRQKKEYESPVLSFWEFSFDAIMLEQSQVPVGDPTDDTEADEAKLINFSNYDWEE